MKFGQWLGLIAIAAALVLLWSLRDVLIHVFAAIVLAMALCTLVGVVRQRLGCGRPIALLLTLVGLLLLAVVVSAAVVPPFVQQFQELLRQLPAAAALSVKLLRQALDQSSRMIYGKEALQWLQQTWTAPLADPGLSSGVGRLLGLAGNLGSGLVQLLFVVSVAVMIAVQPIAYREVAVLLAPSFYRRRLRQVLVHCGEALSSWMGGVLISSCCVALLAGIGLSLLGVNLVVANALLAGLLNVIPNVGPTLSTIFPMSVALLASPWKALAVLGLYVLVQHLESYVITPSVMHHQVKLLPGLTLIAQFVFTVLFGPLGLLLALPLAVSLQVVVREVLIHDVLDPWRQQRLAR
ncbi:AI-2E family transporter [Synechococcus sp. HJ21-Hayes]|uniref:AI-2E family transporter n=1 Tax=unclassified Synechococcus TaxID=2626047 RepID=UPI0020CE17AA|nr:MULTISPECIES: AI-2E family transporter [unclassified Synechococcus]MCP9831172.1 AI-2E family transporter [Synechococcus sp. JJ3a-Johnson]MCP9852014.1 AI-2E family transporter [Synechococcus sp. HJ21-Hayes]